MSTHPPAKKPKRQLVSGTALIDELKSIIGPSISPDVLKQLIKKSEGNLERAVNMYFDKTWGVTEKPWSVRYIGSFGLEGWACVSGKTFLSAGEAVILKKQAFLGNKKRSKQAQVQKGTKTRILDHKTPNIIRFYNSEGKEVGRIPHEPAIHMSFLLDRDICTFSASCIYAPTEMRIGDKILLQISCFIHRHAFSTTRNHIFHKKNIIDIHETEETIELRRMAILWLLTQIGHEPDHSKTPNNRTNLKDIIEATKKIYEPVPFKETEVYSSDGNILTFDDKSKELEKEQLDFLYKNTKSYDPNMKEMDPPCSFNLELKPYQKQALYWMVNKELENNSLKGTDTIHPLWQVFHWPLCDEDGKKSNFENADDQFYVNPYSGKLSLEFPKMDYAYCGGILADEMGLGKTIEILSLIHSNRLDTSSNTTPFIVSSNTSIQPCRTTLVVAPMSLLEQWRSEAEFASKPNTLKVQIYYGIDKSIDILTQCQTNSQPDLLITSYGVVLSEWSQTIANKATFNLFEIDFYRIVLDEAHYIKNKLSKTAKACSALNSKRRWVLTGTPIVNKLEDLFSLIHFLKVEPWGNFVFWKTFITIPFESKNIIRALNTVSMIFKNLILRRTKTTKDIHGNLIIDLPPKEIITEEIVLSPKEREIYDFIYTKAKQTFIESSAVGTVFKNYITILTMLLRLRQSCCHPSLIKHSAKNDFFDLLPYKEDINNSVDINNDIDLKNLIESFNNQVTKEKNINAYGAYVIENILEKIENECPICSADPIIDEAITPCWHIACRPCLKQHIEFQESRGEKPLCHICRSPINNHDIYNIIRKESHDATKNINQVILQKSTFISSSKLDALLRHLSELKKSNPYAKSIVFSQFTSFLNLVEVYMKRDNFEFLRLDGGMTMKERSIVLEKFRTETKGLILLVSQKSGNVGLNLTAASSVFILDPWWNFSMEDQAIDRVHRIGQTSPVKIIRFIVKDSVEEKMIQICQRKLMLASVSVMGHQSREEITKQRLEELQTLFEI
ncbi:hypothetical protein PORY_000335 [Pneumocystis oryctolagi]|uniref:Uncharacterized protein n=1 Tax=Pneumocystis oryctolagi TaxID=42067 RepID=A0ACB7CEY5_9ASCO|nr:hypothetical protein PORY_000335 [Pneumocystis oryctolagi]